MLQKLIEFIAPPDCSVCSRPGQNLCKDCLETATVPKVPSCYFCNRLTLDGRACPVCVRKTSLRGAYILWRYEGAAKDLVHRLKYANDRAVARLMASQAIKEFSLEGYDLVTFVASDGAALRRRGYNQAELLAGAVAKQARLPHRNVLLRIRHIPQTHLSRAKRLAGVKDNFVCFRPKEVAGKKVLIVDDVVTTGATMNECARVLSAAGAKSVWGLAIAKK